MGLDKLWFVALPGMIANIPPFPVKKRLNLGKVLTQLGLIASCCAAFGNSISDGPLEEVKCSDISQHSTAHL